MSGSIAFDRAAGYYDATRALPDEDLDKVIGILSREIHGRHPCLEVGIGTGRIGRPLAKAGHQMIGLDLSAPMLSRLRENLGRDKAFPLIRGDTTRLAVGDATVGSAVACHVLHLIPNWRAAVLELKRVIRPGGVFLLDLGGGPGGIWKTLFRKVVGQLGKAEPRIGLNDLSQLEDLVRQLGGRSTALERVVSTGTCSVAAVLQTFEAQIHAWTWDVPKPEMAAAVDRVRAWALDHVGDLELSREVETVIQWRAYEW